MGEITERLIAVRDRIKPLARFGEDNVWRPAKDAVDVMADAANRIQDLEAALPDWRTIEAAPRDGREIIGFRLDQGVFVFRWAWMAEFVPKDENGDPTEDYDDSFAWWWHDRWGWLERELVPTHWMSLPKAPSA